MKQITSISLSSLTVGTHLQFHTQVNSYIGVATAAALKIESQAPEYESLVGTEETVVNRPTSQRYTEQLATADRNRDDATSVFLNIVKAQNRSVEPNKKAAAQELKSVIAPYNNVAEQAYMKETAQIRGLLTALKEEKNQALVKLLHLEEEVIGIEETNGVFETLYEKSQEDALVRQELEAIDTKELRSQVDAKYQEIVLIVNAFAIATPSEVFDTFIDSVNGLIYRTKQEASHTGNKPSPSPEEEEPVQPEETV